MRRLLAASAVVLVPLAAAATPAPAAKRVTATCKTNGGLSSCLTLRNTGRGPAFRFRTGGALGGTITVGRGGASTRPFTTNATGVATGLNADRLDGLDAQDIIDRARQGLTSTIDTSAFLPVKGKAADADKLDGLDVSRFLLADATAVNASKLGGLDATKFLRSDAKAVDADKLDGQDATAFLGATAKAADADELDGQDSSAFLGATAKATDADKLDGFDSTEFVSRATIRAVDPIGLDEGESAGLLSSQTVSLGVQCVDVGGDTGLRFTLDTGEDGTRAYGSARPASATATPGPFNVSDPPTTFLEVLADGSGDEVSTVELSVVTPGGHVLTATLTVSLEINADDCTVAGVFHDA